MSIVLFTNCQGPVIYNNYLRHLDFFTKHKLIWVPNYVTPITIEDKNHISDSDIFIYQPVNNYTVNVNAEDDLVSLLKPSCIKICFPSLYIDMWPLYEEGGLYCGGNVINDYINMGYSIDKILHMYNNKEICFDLHNRINKSLQYLKNKEDNYCNIKVSNFIYANYKTHKLFDTQNHPNGIIMSYVAKEISKFLNVEFPDIDFFLQKDVHVISLQWPDSLYMKTELELEFIIDDNQEHYRNLIIMLYNNTSLIKYKYL